MILAIDLISTHEAFKISCLVEIIDEDTEAKKEESQRMGSRLQPT